MTMLLAKPTKKSLPLTLTRRLKFQRLSASRVIAQAHQQSGLAVRGSRDSAAGSRTALAIVVSEP